MREVSRSRVLTADEERTAAAKIVALRTSVWRAILSYPPFVGGIVDDLAQQLSSPEDERPQTDAAPSILPILTAAKRAARAYRDRETRANQDAFHATRSAAGEAIGAHDLDGEHAERIIASLGAVARRERDAVCFEYTAPPRKSRPFESYHQRVLAADKALRAMKNRFVHANLRLVISIANRFDYGALPLQDLIQEGNVGLMKAVDRFDVERGFRFSTYASWWIRHAINRAIANKGRTVRLPAHVTADQQKIARAKRDHELNTGTRPSLEEIAKATGLTIARVTKLSKIPLDAAVSLDLQIGDSDSRSLLDIFADERAVGPAQALEQDDIAAVLRNLLDELNPIELDILSRRFGLDDDEVMTLRELGDLHSLSRERIRQLQERALTKLRAGFKQHNIL